MKLNHFISADVCLGAADVRFRTLLSSFHVHVSSTNVTMEGHSNLPEPKCPAVFELTMSRVLEFTVNGVCAFPDGT